MNMDLLPVAKGGRGGNTASAGRAGTCCLDREHSAAEPQPNGLLGWH